MLAAVENDTVHTECKTETPEQHLKEFAARFEPSIGELIRECRAAMRKRFPAANELVYDNYNFSCSTLVRRGDPPIVLCRLPRNPKGLV